MSRTQTSKALRWRAAIALVAAAAGSKSVAGGLALGIVLSATGVAAQDCDYKVVTAIGAECPVAPATRACIDCPKNGAACAAKPSCVASGCALTLAGAAGQPCGDCAAGSRELSKEWFCFTPKPKTSATPTPTPAGVWEVVAVGQDCEGSDLPGQVSCGSAMPKPGRCDQKGKTAVCWDGATFQNADPKYCSNSLTEPWCTYKNTAAANCTGGKALGTVYECK